MEKKNYRIFPSLPDGYFVFSKKGKKARERNGSNFRKPIRNGREE